VNPHCAGPLGGGCSESTAAAAVGNTRRAAKVHSTYKLRTLRALDHSGFHLVLFILPSVISFRSRKCSREVCMRQVNWYSRLHLAVLIFRATRAAAARRRRAHRLPPVLFAGLLNHWGQRRPCGNSRQTDLDLSLVHLVRRAAWHPFPAAARTSFQSARLTTARDRSELRAGGDPQNFRATVDDRCRRADPRRAGRVGSVTRHRARAASLRAASQRESAQPTRMRRSRQACFGGADAGRRRRSVFWGADATDFRDCVSARIGACWITKDEESVSAAGRVAKRESG
jgi:hypothetical protein